MSKLLRPSDDLIIGRIHLNPGRPSDYTRGRAAEFAELDERERFLRQGISPLAAWYCSLELASKSDYLENKNLDHNLGKTSFTMPATVALALCTVVPEDGKTGATITEASYTGYARKKVEASVLNAAASGSSTTNAILEFAACTAGSSTIIGWALCDSSTTGAGNMLYWGTATSTVISTTATPPTIASGGLVVNED